ncbi:glycosyltransferase [Erythrobacter oryzae]|uniref:glycosyltransferase n=1 Tax=Erythrobacter oryzae TaxID=3019556 RepID=UPI00255373FF|nr:glycosyltransferase [Erythrobacter sp. COR-2]
MTRLAPPLSKAGGRDRPYVLHLSGDFPDPVESFKTKVIKTLVDLTADAFDHRVVSINRVSPKAGALASLLPGQPIRIVEQAFEHGIALSYVAPGRGIMHRTMLRKLADWLTARLLAEDRRPDLIVGHKLTIEGIAVRQVAERLGIPYAISIQGDTDTKILSVRRDLGGEYRRILEGASMVFPFSPWAFERILSQLGIAELPFLMLPCPTDIDTPLAPRIGGEGCVSVFHLKSFKRKNLGHMVGAARLLAQDSSGFPGLTVIGGGEPGEVAACKALIGDTPGVVLAGPMGREDVRQRLNRATAFVLPSVSETFGLVFVEALFAGTPIIYPAGTAVDGYFDDCGFAIRVDARDPRAIADAMARACREEQALKAELAVWQTSEHARQFMRPAIAATFAAGLNRAMAGSAASG